MLEPCSIFGIVDHRGDENVPQNRKGEKGDLNLSHRIMLVKQAGFELLAQSELEANSRKATKQHSDGVYSWPPA